MRLCLCATTLSDCTLPSCEDPRQARTTEPDRAQNARTTEPDRAQNARTTEPDRAQVARTTEPDRAQVARTTEPDRAQNARTTEPDRAQNARTTEPDRALPSGEDLRIARTMGLDDSSPARTVEEAIYAASGTGFRCLELSIEAVEGYLAVYPLVVLDALLVEHGCHIGAISGFALDANPTENETGQWSLLQARFLEICTNVDGLGGGIITLDSVAEKEHVPALQALSALAEPYDVQIALECSAAKGDEWLSLTKGADLLQAIHSPNVGLAYTVGEAEVSLSQQAQLDEFADRVLILRCLVSDKTALRAIVDGHRGLCSIKPPAGLNPLEAARAAAEIAASIGLAPTGTASLTRQT
jgi:hypothetical protein